VLDLPAASLQVVRPQWSRRRPASELRSGGGFGRDLIAFSSFPEGLSAYSKDPCVIFHFLRVLMQHLFGCLHPTLFKENKNKAENRSSPFKSRVISLNRSVGRKTTARVSLETPCERRRRLHVPVSFGWGQFSRGDACIRDFFNSALFFSIYRTRILLM
jgi:hypothetical protein